MGILVNIWARIIHDHVFGPILLLRHMNGNLYFVFLQEVMPELLKHIPTYGCGYSTHVYHSITLWMYVVTRNLCIWYYGCDGRGNWTAPSAEFSLPRFIYNVIPFWWKSCQFSEICVTIRCISFELCGNCVLHRF